LPPNKNTLKKKIPGLFISSHKRRALLIGVNYINTPVELTGCINDVGKMKEFLISQGFDEIRTVTDASPDTSLHPTKTYLLECFHKLVEGAQPGDCFFLHFSGHGEGDEVDGYDRTILPCDYQTNGEILDDELHDVLVKPLPKGCKLTVVFDCCHSASALNLPYKYDLDGVIIPPMYRKISAMKRVFRSIGKGELAKLGHSKHVLTSNKDAILAAKRKAEETKTSKAEVIMFGGCEDFQKSADAKINDEPAGAMTWAFLKAANDYPIRELEYPLTLIEFLGEIRRNLDGAKYRQVPQLSTGFEMDVANTVFTLD
ncbi:Ca(2+)-dependent cysteine protease, partial [Globomyces sp. JEL0801]